MENLYLTRRLFKKARKLELAKIFFIAGVPGRTQRRRDMKFPRPCRPTFWHKLERLMPHDGGSFGLVLRY